MKITYQKFVFTLEALEPLIMPYYKGSTIRGGFGNAFKKIVCALKNKECRLCLLNVQCIYSYIFETAPAGETEIMGMGKYEKIPHPYIIEPPSETKHAYKPGELLSFGLILIGKAVDYLPYFIYTFEELGKSGIGKGRGRYILKTVTDNEREIYSDAERTIRASNKQELDVSYMANQDEHCEISVKLNFTTPARISYQRMLTDHLDFHIFMRNLVRRLNLLHYFHCRKIAVEWDYNRIIDDAAKIEIEENNLQWWDWKRYSSRQKTKIKMGGLTGKIVYKGNIMPFMPLIKAGQVLHAGKGTSFGLGKYEII